MHALKYIDALFISTTSVCVTGLTTVDVATTFTHTGQVIIMLLIQIGGIGVMTFTSFFALSFMGNSSFSSKLALKNILSVDNVNGIFRMIINILIVTLIIEGLGAYFIFKEIEYILPGNMYEKLFYAIFHSISAFCNAGISTLSGNMLDGYEKAVNYIEQLEKKKCDYLEGIFEDIAPLLNDSDMEDEANDFIRRGLKQFPDNIILMEELCYNLENKGELDEAIQICNKLIDINPYSYDYWFLLGRLYSSIPNYDKAIEALDFAIT